VSESERWAEFVAGRLSEIGTAPQRAALLALCDRVGRRPAVSTAEGEAGEVGIVAEWSFYDCKATSVVEIYDASFVWYHRDPVADVSHELAGALPWPPGLVDVIADSFPAVPT